MATDAARSRAGLLAGGALALLLLGPLLGPGYVLVRDMVFVPRVPLSGRLLGLEGVPRGVPSELVVALASRVVAAGWLQDLVLVGLVVAGAWGAARLAPVDGRVGALVAATAYGWSPFLHERLLLGQWALLLGWAVLPWATRAALAWRRGEPGAPAVGALAVAALGGANALLLVALVVVVCGRPGRALVAAAVLALPWAVPALAQSQTAGDPGGVLAFAARSDTPLGLVGSLLTGGGVWAREAVPPGRAAGAWLAVLLLVLAAVGLTALHRRLGPRPGAAAAVGLVLALLGSLPGTREALRWAVEHVPASGLLRDGQKWVAPLVLLVAVAAACGAERLLAQVRDVGVRRVAAALLVLAPLAALPGAAWGEAGRLEVSTYPEDWLRVTGQAGGQVLVLPWSLYRAYPFAHGVPVLDPATKLLARPVVNDDLPLGGRTVRGEDPVARGLDAAVRSGAPLGPALQAAGVRQVLVERTTAGYDPALVAEQVRGLPLRVQTRELALYDVPGAGDGPRGTSWLVVLPGDLLALGLGTAATAATVRTARRRRTPHTRPS